MAVLVRDKRKRRLMPRSEKGARLLLERGRAVVVRRMRADILKGKKTKTHLGRVAVRASGSFNVQTPTGVVAGINVRHCTLAHRSDGYSYRGPRLLPTDKSGAIRRGKIR